MLRVIVAGLIVACSSNAATSAENHIEEIHRAFFCAGTLAPASEAGIQPIVEMVEKWTAYGDALLAKQFSETEAAFIRAAFYSEGVRKLDPASQDFSEIEYYGEECTRPPSAPM